MPSNRRSSRSKKYRETLPGYESNAERVLEHSLAHPSPRALHAARVKAEVKLVHKQGRPSTTAEVQSRHSFTEEAAQKLLSAVARALRKPEKPDILTKATQKKAIHLAPAAPPPAPANVPDVRTNVSATSVQAQLAVVLADIRRRYEVEIRTKGEQTSVKEGFVYLVIHPSFEGWVKAGMTIDYELRLATYNVADPLSRFELKATKWVADRRNAEKKLLERLRQAAGEMRGEWAHIELMEAVKIFDAL